MKCERSDEMNWKKKLLLIVTVISLMMTVTGCGVFSDDQRVNEMFVSGGSMYYTNYKDTLYRYDNLSGKGKVVSKLNIRYASQVFEDKGYIYYSNGSAISRKSLSDGSTVRLVKGENISVGMVSGSSLVYASAQRDVNGKGFSEFEYRMYNLLTGEDILLFKRSNDFWHFLAADENILIADASLQDDSGLYSIDLATGTTKKLLSLRVHEGYIVNGKFYYTSQEEKGLGSIDLNGDDPEGIPLPGIDETFFVKRITGFGDFLYVAAYYDGEGHIIFMHLKTHKTTILANGFGAIWDLCSDGKTLYVYDTKSTTDKKGNITVIPLE